MCWAVTGLSPIARADEASATTNRRQIEYEVEPVPTAWWFHSEVSSAAVLVHSNGGMSPAAMKASGEYQVKVASMPASTGTPYAISRNRRVPRPGPAEAGGSSGHGPRT